MPTRTKLYNIRKAKEYTVDKDGNMTVFQAGPGRRNATYNSLALGCKRLPANPFPGLMRLTKLEKIRGRHHAVIWLKNQFDEKLYPVMEREFNWFLRNEQFTAGNLIDCHWGFCLWRDYQGVFPILDVD